MTPFRQQLRWRAGALTPPLMLAAHTGFMPALLRPSPRGRLGRASSFEKPARGKEHHHCCQITPRNRGQTGAFDGQWNSLGC